MWPDPISEALELTEGALYRKCALQVNPAHYRETYRGKNGGSEEQYVQSLLDVAEEQGISVLAVTDHNHVGAVELISREAEMRGIVVFPGFEASSREGVHVLCLFEPGTDQDTLERYLGALEIHDTEPNPNLTSKSFGELCKFVNGQGGVAIAAHITNSSGLLETLRGQACIQAWRTEELLAAQIPGSISGLPPKFRQIVRNVNPDYRRDAAPTSDQAIAVVNAKDVAEPADLEEPAASSMIKMTEPTIEALKQACLDPASRIRLHSDPVPPERPRLVAVAWEGGFFDGVRVRLNRNLNVLIGGKGTGKSTLIESLRYVLGLSPDAPEAKRSHEQIIQHVVQPGTRISLLVYSPTPSPKHYLIQRTVPNPPQVLDGGGELLDLTPSEVMGGVEIFGQHEIGELTRSPQSLSLLLDRFVESLDEIEREKNEVLNALKRNRSQILEEIEEKERLEEQLSELPAVEEELSRFREAGVEGKLQDKAQLIEEEAALDQAEEACSQLGRTVTKLKAASELDLAYLSEEEISDLPGAKPLREVRKTLEDLSEDLEAFWKQATERLDQAEDRIGEIRKAWSQEREKPVNDEYTKLLRELDRDSVDGDTFVRLKKRAERLRPKKKRVEEREKKLTEIRALRKELTSQWEENRREEFTARTKAARFVSDELEQQVRVGVVYTGNRDPVVDILREEVGGRLQEAENAIRNRDQFSLPEFVGNCRDGVEKLEEEYDEMTQHQASSIAGAGEDLFMRLEELELPHTVQVELNVAAEQADPVWRPMHRLSAGQKATAALLLLLLESDAPLIVDQPEDDLDNRFIAEGIVPRMRSEKRRRQFVFATHNANLPVLGDAELIVGLSAEGEPGGGRATIPEEAMGSIDVPPVQILVEEVLEGGRSAFETRRKKYGF